MKISVIIPAYNGEKWIAQCIESVLYQSYKNLEVIVVDDGSIDRTAEIASGYPSVKLLRQSNSGLSVSRNRGAAEATGDYIHFLDVDDVVNLDYYTRMALAIADTGADMAFGGLVNEAQPGLGMIFDERVLLSAAEDKVSVTNAANMGYAVRYLIKRSFVERLGLTFEPGRLIEDIPFTLQAVIAAHRVVTVPGAIYYYMNRPGSILNSREGNFSRQRAWHLSKSRAARREMMKDHNLGSVVRPVKKTQYKIFGIPMATKVVCNHGRSRWYLFGIRIAQWKDVK